MKRGNNTAGSGQVREQAGRGNAEHWVVHKMLFRWYINKDWMKMDTLCG